MKNDHLKKVVNFLFVNKRKLHNPILHKLVKNRFLISEKFTTILVIFFNPAFRLG